MTFKNLFLIGLGMLFFSCTPSKPIEEAKINGYWEIQNVVLPDGSEKGYKVNESIDYFEIKNHKGFRKKVHPQLDGSYLVSDDFEDVKVIQQSGKSYLVYPKTKDTVKEEILQASEHFLVLKDAKGFEYQYNRQEPYSKK
ncbi:hypothetical protein B0A58_01170 [Flavobacterium branchiophilum NBRC 15030 = ATCC 35035]|uniref:Lipocalin-like domain-containing protein n=3 Tax=Flavobacterium branchiophilum TaxID=55197 RepID=G2Z0N5_FLABF|nr:hypothetical protein [Flavobacterium branchiophilum]OXA81791.1 hypothetical protein B0A58_01170 [Flavobacterium branchiophilum NBRC 15030 = ATCC 35035]PDS26283.1 hypothetical protein B0A77_02950 [Flavobacterium branchiophilum]GEM54366.1 hypothetical protein FB1_05870 [Flavobacterium branchiophilum NBRC 15030 = ATCC 35035]CCB69440.1 Protein of unknown function [Flavobacterium branchiophilum FL-15]